MEINPSSVASFANIFSHSEGCLFVLLMIAFAVQIPLNLIGPHVFIFVFIFTALGGEVKKGLAAIYVKKCSSCFPLKDL